MTKKEFETLKVGNIVSPLFGKYKGELCVVDFIWDGHNYDNNYRECLIAANYINTSISIKKSENATDLFISYRAFKRMTAFDVPPVNKETVRIIDALYNNAVNEYNKRGGETYEQ